MKVEAEDLWPLILDFVETHFGDEELESFKKFFKLKVAHKSNPLVLAGGIQAMLGCFLKQNKEVFKSFKTHLQAKDGKVEPKKSKKVVESSSSSSSESSEEEKPKKKAVVVDAKKVVGQKRKTKEESSSDDDDDESSSDDKESSSDDSSSDDDKKNKKKPTKVAEKANKRKRSDSVSSRTRALSDAKEEMPPPAKVLAPPPGNYKFQRINDDKYRAVVANANKEGASFESKGAYGGEGDKFGEWSYDRLKDKRGESFKKEKGKMKNRNFHSMGQRISHVVNSIKF